MTAPKVFSIASALAAAAVLQPSDSLARMADDPFAGLTAIGRAEMGDMRGGMMINGIPVNFAVVIKTTVEGALAAGGLQTTLKVDDAGGLAGMTTTAIGAGYVDAAGDGTAMSIADGAAAIIHRVMDGQIQAMIANTLDDVSITHQTHVNVTMPGFNRLAQTHFSHSRVSELGREAVMVGLGRY